MLLPKYPLHEKTAWILPAARLLITEIDTTSQTLTSGTPHALNSVYIICTHS